MTLGTKVGTGTMAYEKKPEHGPFFKELLYDPDFEYV